MARSRKSHQQTTSVADAIGHAWSEIQSLAEEVREIVDNASGTGLENTQRIQTLGETADVLEGLDEPEVPDALDGTTVSFSEQLPTRRDRGLSRAARASNAESAISAAAEAARAWLEETNEESDAYAAVEQLADDLESAASDLSSAEFPGMFG